MRITRLGHSAVLVESGGTRLLIDPGVFSLPSTFELSGLDAVVVTHQHPDHLDPERVAALLEASPDAVLLADPQTADQQGGRWRAHTDGETTTVGVLRLTATGSQHAPILEQLPGVTNVGVVVDDGATTLFHPGDSYEADPGPVDVLALPLTAPWARISETVAFAERIAPAHLFPIHDGAIREEAYAIYWGHVERFGGPGDKHRLSPGDVWDA